MLRIWFNIMVQLLCPQTLLSDRVRVNPILKVHLPKTFLYSLTYLHAMSISIRFWINRWHSLGEAVIKGFWSSGEVGQRKMLLGSPGQSSRGWHQIYLPSLTTTTSSRRVTRQSWVFPTRGELMRTSPDPTGRVARTDDTEASSSSSTVPALVHMMLQSCTSPDDAPAPDSSGARTEGILVIFVFIYYFLSVVIFEDPAWFAQSSGICWFLFGSIPSPFEVCLVMT